MDTSVTLVSEAREATRKKRTPGFYIKRRWILAVMGFCALANVIALRNNLSVAIVAMVNATEEENADVHQADVCPERSRHSSTAPSNGVFDWGPAQQGLALGCYFYGYAFSNVPGAWLTKRYGFKRVLGSTMLLSSALTVCLPVAASTSFEIFVGLRVILGSLQGLTSPSVMHMWAKWGPPAEKNILISVCFSAFSFGPCIVLPSVSFVADVLGWEATFYVTGSITAVWTFLWLAVVHDSPESHPRISEQEKEYLMKSIALNTSKDKNSVTPWKSIFTSLPLFGIATSHFASNWGNLTLTALLPTYMATILKFDISLSGSLTALPFILRGLVTLLGGYITDRVRTRKIVSTVVIRKINTTLGLCVPALFLILAGYVGCNITAAIVFFTLSIGLNGLTVPGCQANTSDIAPKYSGILYGISNTLAAIPGFLAPQIAGVILQDVHSIQQWQVVFWVSAAVYVAGALIYGVFGSGVEQSWAKDDVKGTNNEA